MDDSSLELLEDFLKWRNEQRLDPPTFSPKEYLMYLQNQKNSAILDEVKALIEKHKDDAKNNALIKSLLYIVEGS